MPKAQADIRSFARTHTKKAIQALAGIGFNTKAPAAARVSALSAILDRGWGKPTQPVAGDESMDPIQMIVRKIVDPGNSDS